MAEEYTSFDAGYSSTVAQKKTLPIETELCPHHAKLKKQKEATKKSQPKKSFLFDGILRHWSFKNNLEEKLKKYGIKSTVKMNKRNKILPSSGTENERGDKLTLQELQLLTSPQQEMIINAMETKIAELNNELKELLEENERLSSDKDGLNLTVRNLEELSLRIMKPWSNAVPESDEFTRVMLLN